MQVTRLLLESLFKEKWEDGEEMRTLIFRRPSPDHQKQPKNKQKNRITVI